MHTFMDKNLFFVEVPGLGLMFIVLRFPGLVDYLTSFSGVDLSFLIQMLFVSSAELTSKCSDSCIFL